MLDTPPALAWVANYGAIELHPWTSTAEHPHQPTWAMIDIDPGESTHVRRRPRARPPAPHRARPPRRAGVPKVTGQRGIQIWVPVADGYDVRRHPRRGSRRCRTVVGATVPDLVSWEWEVAERGGKVRLDYTQNAINKTLVAPFAVRPAPGAPVSVPITWDELDDPDLRPDRWTIGNVAERLAEAGDPLAPLIGLQQRLPILDG